MDALCTSATSALRRISRAGAKLLTVLVAPVLFGCTDSREPLGPTSAQTPQLLLLSPPNSFTQMDAGGSHACAVRTDGVVECWGDDGDGQAPATRMAMSGAFTQVSGGGAHTCAVRTDGVVECWGKNLSGQAPAIKTPATGAFTQVTAAANHTCALRTDGVVECWGNNTFGPAPATKSAASGSFKAVAAGFLHTCALRTDGVIECWGARDPDVPDLAPTTKTAASGSFTQLGAGHFHTCAVRTDGVVECWGANNGEQAPTTKSPASSTFKQVTGGLRHSCALRLDGVVECWGDDGEGQAPATKSAATGAFTSVSAGGSHTCALRTDGVVECWGSPGSGRAPATKTANSHVYPTATFSATPASVAARESFTLGLANAQVPGHPEATQFTYAFDCGDGTGYGAFGSSASATCLTTAAGTRAVKGKVRDQDLDESEYTATVEVTDVTPPVITPTITGTQGKNGWYTSDVTVTWSTEDGESTVTSAPCAQTKISADTWGQDVTCTATSTGGTASKSVTIKRDATAPTIAVVNVSPLANAAGWNNANVTVNWTCSDLRSGLVASNPLTQTVTTEGQNQSVTGQCTDNAGNLSQDVYAGINVDKTAPALAPTVSPNPVLLNGSATATPNGSDALSGVESSSCGSPVTSAVGTKTVSCSATDKAGNAKTASATYVVTYQFVGFDSPVAGGAVVNVVNAGQTIPFKWRLLNATGVPITNLTSVTVTATALACSATGTVASAQQSASSASGLQNLGDGYYQYNWTSPKNYAGTCKTLHVNLGEGITRTAAFQFSR